MNTTASQTIYGAPLTLRAARRRRLNQQLYDLGLLTIVGSDWVRPTHNGFRFRPIEGRAAEELLRQLDQLAAGSPNSRALRAIAGQQVLPLGLSGGATVGGDS